MAAFISGGAPRSDGRIHMGEDACCAARLLDLCARRLKILSTSWNTYGGWTVLGRDTKGHKWCFHE